ncbi:MAG: Na+/H+ antiporter subunit D [Anaerolineales bacterium]|nr:Na+/H+ antiporter subunit D [Anaerolineales bacterium]
MTNLVLLPFLLPFLTAIVSLFFWGNRPVQRALNVLGSAILLLVAIVLLVRVQADGIQVLQAGNWPAPFGITIAVDLLSAIMVLLASLTGLGVAVYALADIDNQREAFGFHPLFQFLLMGINGSFVTGDIFNLYVWFEIMLIASFVLLSLGGERRQLAGSIKYVTINLVASAIFVAAIGLLYSLTGSLNMAHLAQLIPEVENQGLLTAVAMMFLAAFGIKAGLFPLYFWLPSSYHTPPAAVSGIFAGLLTKVGVYALIRVFTLLFIGNISYTHHGVLLVLAGAAMVMGVFGAASQMEIRRILSFHIVSQIGYMVMGLALFTPLALAGTVFYLMHHIIVKANLFLIGGIMNRLQGSYRLLELGSFYRRYPALAVLFMIPALSLAGIPPLSGFWAKLALVRAGLSAGQYAIVAVSLFVSLLTLYSMTKIWSYAFWTEREEPAGAPPPPPLAAADWRRLLPVSLLAGLTVLVGLTAGPLFELAQAASAQLLNPQLYIDAVLSAGGIHANP